jgi:ribose transport system permease protein
MSSKLRSTLSFSNIGALYVWVLICIIFSIWVPDTFPTWATAKQILNGNAVLAMLALSLLIPLSAGVFDLSTAYTATLSGVLLAKLVVAGVPLGLSILIAIGAALLIGLLNALVVVVMRVDSFIGTLATGSLILALISMVTGDLTIQDPRLTGTFLKIGQGELFGVTYPVYYTLVIAGAIWYLLETTATGRRLYATGFNERTARLAGVRTDRLRFGSLLASAFVGGVAGVVLTSIIGSGDPTAGPPYLLSAFAAAFLGATQLRGGRFNVPGTLIAILLLGTGTIGLGLAAQPQWVLNMFTGVVLIAALAVTGLQRRRTGRASWWKRRQERQEMSDDQAGTPHGSQGVVGQASSPGLQGTHPGGDLEASAPLVTTSNPSSSTSPERGESGS